MTVAVTLAPPLILQFFNNAGQPNVGGSVLTQVGGVNYPTYQDSAGATPLPNPIPLNSRGEISNASGTSCQLFLVSGIVYTMTIYDANGNQIDQATSVTAGLTATEIGELLYPQTAAEIAAGVTPTVYTYAPGNVLRYGANNGGGTSYASANVTAFNNLLAVAINGQSACVIPAGTYATNASIAAIILPTSGASAATLGISIYAYGAVISYVGTGYAWDMTGQVQSPYNYKPFMTVMGLNIVLANTASVLAAGGFRQTDLDLMVYQDCFVTGNATYVSGAGFTQQTLNVISEQNAYIRCGVVTCNTGIQFTFQTGGSGNQSMARTLVRDFFGAGIQYYWFDCGPQCDLYDSIFENIRGNFGSIAYFGIGSNTNGANMTGTVIYPIQAEWDGNPNSYAQCIIRLRDYPTASNDNRPILYTPNPNAVITSGANLPVWAAGTSNTTQTIIPGPELTELQSASWSVPLTSTFGQSALFEPNFNAYGQRNAATVGGILSNVAQGSEVTMSGFTTTVTGRLKMQRAGALACLSVYDPLTGTSNANTMTMQITQAEFIPSSVQVQHCLLEDNGITSVPGQAYFNAPSTYTTGTFTSAPAAGAISATLSANWSNPTGTYLMVFSDAETRPVTLTNGAATCTWSSPLSSTVTTAWTIQCCVVTFSIATAFNTYSSTGFTTSGTKGLGAGWVFAINL